MSSELEKLCHELHIPGNAMKLAKAAMIMEKALNIIMVESSPAIPVEDFPCRLTEMSLIAKNAEAEVERIISKEKK